MGTRKNLEIEIKLQLGSFTDYLKLLGHLGPIDVEQHHVSGFFDTADRQLGNKGWAFRVRAESDRGLVTLKSLISQSGFAAIRREIEAKIERGKALELIGGFGDVLELPVEPVSFVKKEFPDLSLVKVLQFQNDRQLKRFWMGDQYYVLEIDRTEFSDKSIDYELEVELDDESHSEEVQDRLRKMFNSLGIPFQKQSRSKFERALERSGPA